MMENNLNSLFQRLRDLPEISIVINLASTNGQIGHNVLRYAQIFKINLIIEKELLPCLKLLVSY